MPLSACIEHRTLIRICMYELGRPESEITEEDWNAGSPRPRAASAGYAFLGDEHYATRRGVSSNEASDGLQ